MKHRSGFSLVELSIVLVIIGLLTGGILAGQSLIRAAELRSVAADFGRYHSAVKSFRDQYDALPGDMPDATAFWGAVAGSPGTCLGVAGSGTETCDGNGNGEIGFAPTSFETLRVWQHLSNAELISKGTVGEGRFTGVLTNQSGAFVGYQGGANLPISALGEGIYMLMHNTVNSDAFYEDMSVGGDHIIAMCKASGTSTAPCGFGTGGFVTAEEAFKMDTKMDDGFADSGAFLSDSCVVGGVIFKDYDATECAGTDCDYDFDSANQCTIQFMF